MKALRGHGKFLVALLLASAACADQGARADEGRGAAERVISLIPSATETIVKLGAADRLVARTEYDTEPALAHLPSVGRGLTPSLEALTLLEPDVVIAWPDNMSRSITARLTELGIAVYTPEVQTLADFYQATRELGRRLGLERAAATLIEETRAELRAVERAVAGRRRPAVFYLVWHDPPTTAGPGTYISELIEIAGARNVFADASGLWPQVSLEEVVRRQPDLLILPRGPGPDVDLARLRAAVGWRELRAVREGRVIEVDAELFGRPGPRVAEAAERLARRFHPEAFTAAARR